MVYPRALGFSGSDSGTEERESACATARGLEL